MDEDQQALEWANAHPNDERSGRIKAKIWLKQNPNHPQAPQVQAKLDEFTKQSLEHAKLGKYQEAIEGTLASPLTAAAAGPAAAIAGSKLTSLLQSPAARIAGAVLVSGGLAAIPQPQEGSSRIEQFLKGGAIGAGTQGALELGNKVATGVGKAMKPNKIAQGFKNMSPADTEAFFANKLGKAHAVLEGKDQELSSKIGQVTAGVNKTIQVKPEQFKGSEVYPELENIARMQQGNPSSTLAQGDYLAKTPEFKIPETMSITPAQAVRLKRIAGNASSFKQGVPFDEAKYKAESKAFNDLRGGLEGTVPETGPLNEEWSKNIKLKSQVAKRIQKNPEKIDEKLAEKVDNATGSDLLEHVQGYKAKDEPTPLEKLIKKGLTWGAGAAGAGTAYKAVKDIAE